MEIERRLGGLAIVAESLHRDLLKSERSSSSIGNLGNTIERFDSEYSWLRGQIADLEQRTMLSGQIRPLWQEIRKEVSWLLEEKGADSAGEAHCLLHPRLQRVAVGLRTHRGQSQLTRILVVIHFHGLLQRVSVPSHGTEDGIRSCARLG